MDKNLIDLNLIDLNPIDLNFVDLYQEKKKFPLPPSEGSQFSIPKVEIRLYFLETEKKIFKP